MQQTTTTNTCIQMVDFLFYVSIELIFHQFLPKPKFSRFSQWLLEASMSEKLCLQWNDFQENVKTAFGNLREDKHFTDVTLACEDGQQLEAHKVILAASSPFFQTLLSRNKHPHPLVYMRGLESKDLLAIVEFLYCGEANVYQENFDSFLAIAGELQLKGLMGKMDENVEHTVCDEKSGSQTTKPITKPTKSNGAKTQQTYHLMQTTNEAETDKTVVLSGHNFEELEERVRSMMEKSQNYLANGRWRADICKVCGKEGQADVIKNHIEANHLEGIVIPCNNCEKTFRCRNSLRKHKQRDH